MQAPLTQPAFVLHSRAYKESSALVDLLTPEGRLRAVLRNARGRSGSLVRAFVPLEVELRGRSELKTLGRLETTGLGHFLVGEALFSGLYLNELLIRLLPVQAPYAELFEHYALTVQALALGHPLQPLLRAFEWRLLQELGYGFSLQNDRQGRSIRHDGWYRLSPEGGLELVAQLQPGLFYGQELLAMSEADWSAVGVLASAKRLMRQALAPHLGGKPLASRELFMNYKESSRG